MVRIVSHILFTIFFLVSTTSLTLSVHYCGDELMSASLFTKAKSCCEPGCDSCENKTIHIVVKDDFLGELPLEPVASAVLNLLPAVRLTRLPELNAPWISINYNDSDSSPPEELHTRLSLFQSYLC